MQQLMTYAAFACNALLTRMRQVLEADRETNVDDLRTLKPMSPILITGCSSSTLDKMAPKDETRSPPSLFEYRAIVHQAGYDKQRGELQSQFLDCVDSVTEWALCAKVREAEVKFWKYLKYDVNQAKPIYAIFCEVGCSCPYFCNIEPVAKPNSKLDMWTLSKDDNSGSSNDASTDPVQNDGDSPNNDALTEPV